VPADGLGVTGSGSQRQLQIHPSAGVAGSSTITVTVDDGLATNQRSFVLTITGADPVNAIEGDQQLRATAGRLALPIMAVPDWSPAWLRRPEDCHSTSLWCVACPDAQRGLF